MGGCLISCLSAQALPGATWEVASVADLDTADENLQVGDEIVIATGTYPLDRTIQMNVAGTTIRGSSGVRSDVVLIGGGMNNHGVDEGITVGADDVTIRDLSVSQFYYNGLHTRAEDDVQRTLIANVETRDCGERHIKGSRDPNQELVSAGIIIEDVLMVQDMERSGHPDTDPDYIGGIDMMCTDDIIIRNCVAQGIHGQDDGGNAAIFLWNGAQNPTITGNQVLGCAKGIALGNPAVPGAFLATGAWHAVGGLIADNVILRGSWETGNNISIELCSTKDVSVCDNTVYSDDATYFRTLSISDCQPTVGLTTGLTLIGNVVRGQLLDLTAGGGWSQSGNLIDGSGTTILPTWFTAPDQGDYHLTPLASGAIGMGTPLAAVPTDFYGTTRSVPGDIGAVQSAETTPGGSSSSSSSTTTSTTTATGTTGSVTTGSGAGSGGSAAGTTSATTTGSSQPSAAGGGSGSGCGLGAGAGALLITTSLVGARSWRRRIRGCASVALLLLILPMLDAQTDETEANSYDAAWLGGWISHCQGVYTTAGKTVGFVLQVGDSITHANPYSQWPRYGAGQASDDAAIIGWMHATVPFSSTQTDTTSINGWYLAAADTNGSRGMTANSGMQTGQFLSGAGNGGAAMPAASDQATAAGYVADGVTYPNNLNATSVAAAFAQAQFAVLMLGTNDSLNGVSVSQFTSNLTALIGVFESQHIVVILSTIPPNYDPTIDALAVQYCEAIAGVAQRTGLPLIDFRAEILARQPGTAWNGTILTLNDVHPTAGVNGYNSASDPYADGGDASTHLTGAACQNCGYLLRSWLTVQKMKQVKAGVVDGTLTTGSGSTTGTATAPSTTTSGSATGSSATATTTEASATATATTATGTTTSSSGSSAAGTTTATSTTAGGTSAGSAPAGGPGGNGACGLAAGVSCLIAVLLAVTRRRGRCAPGYARVDMRF